MKIVKHQLGGYISEDKSIRIRKCYPSLSANKMFWAVDIKDEKTKYFNTLKEAKFYIDNN